MFFKNKGLRITLGLVVVVIFLFLTVVFAPRHEPAPTVVVPTVNTLEFFVKRLNALRKQEIAMEQLTNGDSFEQAGGQLESSLFLGRIMAVQDFDFWNGTVVLVDYENNNFLITAGHMFANPDPRDNKTLVPLSGLGVTIYIQGRVLKYTERDFTKDLANDFAFMPAPKNLKSDLFLFDKLDLTYQSRLKSYGFPLYNFFVSRGLLTGQTPKTIIHNCKITIGSSGGPVVWVDKNVKKFVGINILTNALDEDSFDPKAVSYELIAQAIKQQSKP